MIKINIIEEDKSWRHFIKNPERYIKQKNIKFNKNFKKYNKKNIFFTLLLSGDRKIKKLNKKFRNRNKTTDILSFPFYQKEELKSKLKKDKKIYLGDIIININKVTSKSKKFYFEAEFNKLWIHGLAHLLGYDHKKDSDFNKMRKVEKKFLSFIN